MATKEVSDEELIIRGRSAAGVVDFVGHVGNTVDASGTASRHSCEIRAGTVWDLSGVNGLARRREVHCGRLKVGE